MFKVLAALGLLVASTVSAQGIPEPRYEYHPDTDSDLMWYAFDKPLPRGVTLQQVALTIIVRDSMQICKDKKPGHLDKPVLIHVSQPLKDEYVQYPLVRCW